MREQRLHGMSSAGLAFSLMMTMAAGVGLGACFNPGSDASGSGPDLGCDPGTFGCPCSGGSCSSGLACVDGICVDEGDVTGSVTSGATSVGSGEAENSAEGGTTSGGTTGLGDDTTMGALDTGPGTTGGVGSTGELGTTSGTTGVGMEESSSGMAPPPAMETVDFPTAADPRMIMSGDRPWNAGDYFEGMRATMVPSISQLDLHLEVPGNSLSPCGFQEAEVSINGVAVGNFTIAQGDMQIDESYPVMPPIVGPDYTIRYETVATVAGGCGSAEYGEVGSTVTFIE